MFEWIFWSSAAEALQKIPKEIVYGTAAYFIITEVHKNHTQMKTSEAEANAKVRAAELEVEKLRLQLDLHNAQATSPPS